MLSCRPVTGLTEPKVNTMRNPMLFFSCAVMLLPAMAAGDHLSDGLAAYNIGDYEKSMENCLPLAEQGVPAAQFCVGRLYAQGFGVPMDDAQAHKWYGLAAEAGHAEAQFNLGVSSVSSSSTTAKRFQSNSNVRRSPTRAFGPSGAMSAPFIPRDHIMFISF